MDGRMDGLLCFLKISTLLKLNPTIPQFGAVPGDQSLARTLWKHPLSSPLNLIPWSEFPLCPREAHAVFELH